MSTQQSILLRSGIQSVRQNVGKTIPKSHSQALKIRSSEVLMIYEGMTMYVTDTSITETHKDARPYAHLIYHVNHHISLCDHDQNSQ